MAVILLTSATGSPGTTTTALGLALTWPLAVVGVIALITFCVLLLRQ